MRRLCRGVFALVCIAGLVACGPQVLVMGDKYPSEYPPAQGSGTCPDLGGTFENTGTPLNSSHSADTPSGPMLSTLMLAPGIVPPGALVTSLQIRGPALGLLDIEAQGAEGTVARSSIPNALEAEAFIHSQPYSKYLCNQSNGPNVMITNAPDSAGSMISSYEAAVRIYRATDGSLIIAREHVHSYLGANDILRYWYRFRQVEATPRPVAAPPASAGG